MPNKNTGLLVEEILGAKDYSFAGVGLEFEQLITGQSWEEYLPVYEPQSKNEFETMACVSFSASNCLETLHKFRTGEEVNYSDRFLAKMSGTTQWGNYMSDVAESIRINGMIDEKVYQFNVYTWNEYYQAVPDPMVKLGKQWLKEYYFGWQWVGGQDGVWGETLSRAIKMSPISVSVQIGSPQNDKGYYINKPGGYGHVVMLYAVEEDHFKCYDHYTNSFKKYDLNYKFGAGMGFSLKLKNDMPDDKPLINVANNTLAMDSLGTGSLGLVLDGKIILDDLPGSPRVLGQFIKRNNGDIKGKTIDLNLEQWASFPKRGFKS